MRYVPGKRKGSAVRKVIATYPLLPSSDGDDQYAPSPDGSKFAMVVNGEPSRLVIVPIKPTATREDFKVIDLVERK